VTERGTRAQFDGRKDEAGVLFAQGVAAGRRAVVLGPDHAEGHFELAVALGSLALHKGGREKIRLSKELKSEVERALVIEPDMDRAHHVLARWHRGVAELSFLERTAAKVIYGGAPTGATMDAALEHFEKAIALNPNYANHHLEYGRTLLKLGLKDKARGEFEKALACPNTSPFDPDYKAEAQQLMAKTR
jgi:tetratricopeptide (TPR) repeat protein